MTFILCRGFYGPQCTAQVFPHWWILACIPWLEPDFEFRYVNSRRQKSRQNTCQFHSPFLAELLKRVISEPVRRAPVLEAELSCGSKICQCIRAGLTVPGQTKGLLGPISSPALPSSYWRVPDQGKPLGILPYNPPTQFESHGLLETDALLLNTVNNIYFSMNLSNHFLNPHHKIHYIPWKGIAQVKCALWRDMSLCFYWIHCTGVHLKTSFG